MLKNKASSKDKCNNNRDYLNYFYKLRMELNISFDQVILIAQIIFVLSVCFQAVFLLGFYIRLAVYKGKSQLRNQPPVSVIIAARNEYENLIQNLPSILEQDYPEFEVVVVNDGSWDDTPTLLAAFQERCPHLKIVYCPDNETYHAGKKMAITLGVKAAKNEQLVFTDADCKPLNNRWLKSMMASMEDNSPIVLGFSPYVKQKGMLNAIIRFDAWFVGLNYLSFALAGIPYMGVGRNMSYRKSQFFDVGGFKTHYHILSGDDDLFINQIANSKNTVISVARDSWVESVPETSWKDYWRQKKRHLTTGWHYKWYHKLLLGLQPLSLLCLIVSSSTLIVFHTWLYIVLVVLIARILTQLIIFRRSSQWLGHERLIFLVPILEIVSMVLNGFILIANASTRQNKWKN